METRAEKNKEIQIQLEEEEFRKHRKKIVCFALKLIIIIIFLFLFIFFYTKYCSTTGLIVKEERLTHKKIPDSFQGIKLIHFSDLYYGSTITIEEVKKLVKTINMRNPDLILFTGNLIDSSYKISTTEQEKLMKELKKLNASIGKYATTGKEDQEQFHTIMMQSEFQVLKNDYDLIYHDDNHPILLVGLSSLLKKERNLEDAYKYFQEDSSNQNIYTICMMSETDGLDDILTKKKTDLVLAGNSLNGQIRIPFVGGIIKKEGSSKYQDSYYRKNDTKIYISSGIGSPDLGFRIFARPSIHFFRLNSKK